MTRRSGRTGLWGALAQAAFLATSAAQSVASIEGAIRATAELAQQAGVRAFQVAILHEDQFIVRGWPKGLAGRSPAFSLLDHSRFVHVLATAQLRARSASVPPASVEVAALQASNNGRIARPVQRVRVDDLLRGVSPLAPLYGPVADAITAGGLSLESFQVFAGDGTMAQPRSVLPLRTVECWLEEHTDRSWPQLVSSLLGPADPGAETLADVSRVLSQLQGREPADAESTEQSPLLDRVPIGSGFCFGAFRAHELLRRLRLELARDADQDGSLLQTLLHPVEETSFQSAFTRRGELATLVAVGKRTAVLMTLLSGDLADGALDEMVCNRLLEKLEDPGTETIRIPGFTTDCRFWVRMSPTKEWTQSTYSGVLRVGERETPVRLSFGGTQGMRIQLETEAGALDVERSAFDRDRAGIIGEAPRGWLPEVLQRAFAESVHCEITLHKEGGSLRGIACFFDDEERGRASSCLPAILSLQAERWSWR